MEKYVVQQSQPVGEVESYPPMGFSKVKLNSYLVETHVSAFLIMIVVVMMEMDMVYQVIHYLDLELETILMQVL